jgi:AcrR family transcriptional regulator
VTATPTVTETPTDAVAEPAPVDASAAPRRERGLRSRAGNAMERTRAAVLDGASRAVEKYGARKATMGDIAILAGIAKGTLYNHFRTKEAVYSAAVDAGVRSLAEECQLIAREDLVEALAVAADRIGSHPALRRVAADEPAVLAALVGLGDGAGWQTARTGVADILDAAGRTHDGASVDVVLRWLVSFVASAGRDVEGQARLVAAAVSSEPARAGTSGTNS